MPETQGVHFVGNGLCAVPQYCAKSLRKGTANTKMWILSLLGQNPGDGTQAVPYKESLSF